MAYLILVFIQEMVVGEFNFKNHIKIPSVHMAWNWHSFTNHHLNAFRFYHNPFWSVDNQMAPVQMLYHRRIPTKSFVQRNFLAHEEIIILSFKILMLFALYDQYYITGLDSWLNV